nr:biotin/lipoyl-binding protein [Microbulbifer sp. GX H0434]
MRPWHWLNHLRRPPLILLALLLALFLLPLPWPVQLPAATYFADRQQVLAPTAGLVAAIPVKPGDRVVAGQLLLKLENSELDYRLQRGRRELQLLQARKNRDGFESALDSLDAVYLQDLLSKERELQSLQAKKAQQQLVAKQSGRVDWRLPGIGRGEHLSVNQPVLSIVDPDSLRGRAYGRTQHVARIRGRTHGRLFLRGRWQAVDVHIETIDDIGSHKLDDPALASTFGGPLRTGDKGERIDEARQRLEFSLAATERRALAGQRIGYLVVFGEPISLLQLLSRRVAGVFVRESGI